MQTKLKLCVAAVSLASASAGAGVTFQLIDTPNILVTGMSGDGDWIVGKSFVDNSVFRYHTPTGSMIVLPSPGALSIGLPDVSDDGQRVIGNFQNAGLSVPGVWTQASGWTAIQPLPNPVNVDGAIGSAFGISGDGQTVTGYLSTATSPNGVPYSSGLGTPSIPLAMLGPNGGRSSCASTDGSVIAGFNNDPAFGFRHAVAWVNGVLYDITPDRWGDAEGINSTGTVLVGNGDKGFGEGAMRWDWDGSGWSATNLGVLPGTDPLNYNTSALASNTAGDMIVGVNRSGSGPIASRADGFLWTPENGMVDLEEILADNGVDIGNFDIQVAAEISDDGMVISGWGVQPPTTRRGWVITITEDCPADLAEPTGVLNFFDLGAFLEAFNNQDPIADFAAPTGVFNFFDLGAFLEAFNEGCP